MAVRKSKRGGTLIERLDAFIDEWSERKGKRIADRTVGWYISNPRIVETIRGGGYPRPPSLEALEQFMAEKRAEWAVEDRSAKPKRKRKRG